MAAEQFSNNAVTTLTSSLDAVVTSVPILSAATFPGSAQYRIIIDNEIMIVTGGAGTATWTVTRGVEGTTAAVHNNGASVRHTITAGALGQLGTAGPQGAQGPVGAQGPIGGLVLTTPPPFALGRELGKATAGGTRTVPLVTTADVNAGETVVLAIRWDHGGPDTTTATTITSIVDSGGLGTWIVEMTNDNIAVVGAGNQTYIATAIGQYPSRLLNGATITVTFDSIGSDIAVTATAFVGIFTPGASTLASQAGVDGSNVAGTAMTSGSVTTVDTQELVIAVWGTRGGSPTVFTPVAGWTAFGQSPALDGSTHASVDLAYKIVSPGAQSPTATMNANVLWTNVIGRYRQGVSWTALPAVINEKIWVTDANYGAHGDGVTDDATAINAAIAAAVSVSGGIVAFEPHKTYIIGHPLEILGRCKVEGFEARSTVIKAKAGYTYSQMLRNWTAADWNSGAGEVDGRTPPANTIFSGTHGIVIYPQIQSLAFNVNSNTNLSVIGWVGTQESSYFKDLQLVGLGGGESNSGIWGFDIRGSATSGGFNYGRIEDCVLYGNGWERQVSLDGALSGGSDFQLERIVFSPAQTNHSQVFVQRLIGVHMHNCHWEGSSTSSALATIVLIGAYGFAMTDCSCTVKGAHQKPWLVQSRFAGAASVETPPDIKGQHFFYSTGGQNASLTDWPNGFIADLFNTIPGAGQVDDSSKTCKGIHMIHHYNGKQMQWTDNTEQLLEKTFH